MTETEITKEAVSNLEFNYKRAVGQMLILKVLSSRDCYIAEIIEEINRCSEGAFCLTFPYTTFRKMIDEGYICDGQRRKAPDERLRQYYKITAKGQELLEVQMEHYRSCSAAVAQVLELTI